MLPITNRIRQVMKISQSSYGMGNPILSNNMSQNGVLIGRNKNNITIPILCRINIGPPSRL